MLMRRNIFLSGLLALCLLLTACGETPQLPEPEGLRREETLLTVDGRDVTAAQYLYWLTTVCRNLEEQYDAAGKSVDWDSPAEEGTLADYAKNQALRSAALYATVENWAERYGCAVTEEEREKLAVQWEEKAAACGGEKAYLALLAERGLDRERAERIAEDHFLYMDLCALAETEGSPLYAADHELREFFAERGYVTVRRLEFSGEGAGDRAAEAFARLNGSADRAAEFDALGGGAARTLLGAEELLLEAAASLEPGQTSGILENGEGGYVILLRLADDLSAVRLAHFDHRLQSAADDAEILVTEEYGSIDVSRLRSGTQQAGKAG